jgi:hypothetical protein
MCCYPILYIALTLPLAVSRMYEVRGVETSNPYRIFCGCFLVSSGKHRLALDALDDHIVTSSDRLGRHLVVRLDKSFVPEVAGSL